MSRSLAEEIELLVKDVANNNPAPKKCVISKIYEDNHVDVDIKVGSEIGTIQYRPCLGNPKIDEEAVIIFVEGSINEGYVICNTEEIELVQSDWEETDISSSAYIKNKPSIPSLENYYNKEESRALLKAYFSGKVVDVQVIDGKLRVTKWEDGDFHVDEDIPLDTDVLKTLQKKLTAGSNITIDENNVISATGGGGSSVQSDWEETDTSSLAYILHKPPIPTNTSDLFNDSDFISDSDYVHTDNNFTTNEKNKLSTLENYDDSEVKSDISSLETTKADKSEIPTATSDLVNDSNFITSSYHDTTKQNTLIAGSNITIVNDVISAVGGGTAQVQSDYAQTDSTQVDFIKNKPNLSIYQEKSTIQSVINTEVHNVLKEIFTGKAAAVAVVNGKLQVTTFEEEDL